MKNNPASAIHFIIDAMQGAWPPSLPLPEASTASRTIDESTAK